MLKRITFLLSLLGVVTLGYAQDNEENNEMTAEELAEKLANPNAPIGTFNTFLDFHGYTGDLPHANEQSSFTLTLQPSLPKPNFIGKQMLFFRPALPILFSPVVYNSETEEFEGLGVQLGDIGYDLALGGTSSKGLLYLVGMNGTIPLATDTKLRGEWTLGPEVVIGLVKKKIVFGGLFSQRWNISGDGNITNVLGGQYFYAFPLKRGHVIGAGPTWNYNWVTEQLTFPIGTGWTKTTKLGDMPFKFGFQIMYFVAQPDPFGPLWQLRIQLTPVLKLPWKG